MARRGENIYKRKDGRWEGRYKNGFKSDGKTKYSSVYGKSYSEVRATLANMRLKTKADIPVCKLKLSEIVNLWLDNIKHSVKESTYANYLMKVEKHILPCLGDIPYEKLTVNILNDFVSLKMSNGLSPKYVADISALIKSISKYASRRYGYADKAKFMTVPKSDNLREKAILSDYEQNILVEELLKNLSKSNAGILLSAATGLRIGELCALKWSDVDFEKRTITVNKTLQRIKSHDKKSATKIIIAPPKSRTSNREIPIPDFLFSTLSNLRTRAEHFILTGTDKFTEPRTMQYRFKNILKRLNLPQVNFHSLRHGFATKCVSLGIDVKTLSEILGHSSVKITLDRYVHSSIDRKRSCMKVLSDSFAVI